MEQATDAHLILDAVHFATETDVAALGRLAAQRSDVLKAELVLRIILTFLPESTDPASYVDLVRETALGDLKSRDHDDSLLQPSKSLSAEQALKGVRGLHLLPLHHSDTAPEDADTLTQFLVSRAHRIDAETGSLLLLRPLLRPFVGHSPFLGNWIVTVVEPLLRYEYDSGLSSFYTLASFEKLKGSTGLDELLGQAAQDEHTSAQSPAWLLRAVVGPWIQGEVARAGAALTDASGNGAASVGPKNVAQALFARLNGWLMDTAKRDFSAACGIFDQWGGPLDVDDDGLRVDKQTKEILAAAISDYAQACLASVYICEDAGSSARSSMRRLLHRTATLNSLPPLSNSESADQLEGQSSLPGSYVGSLSRVHVLPAELLESSNPLTRPSAEALELASNLLRSIEMLESLGHKILLRDALNLGPFGSEADQRSVLLRILHGLVGNGHFPDSRWVSVRKDLHWLRTWNMATATRGLCPAILGRIAADDLEVEMLRALVSDSRFTLASRIYCQSSDRPIAANKAEKVVLEVGFQAYDSASNGNRTRGGMKKAFQLVHAFQPVLPKSIGLRRLSALIQATHSLSFYSLTLQHGVPLLPASVRAHQNPLSLLDKVLEQNPRGYTKLDDLLEIGRNLVRAGLINGKESTGGSEDEVMAEVERSIIALTVRAALAEHDFDTAYAYIVNRLSSPSTASLNQDSQPGDDVLWRAAFEAGRYRPRSSSTPPDLRRLEQKMELLSQALVLAPVSAVSEVLGVWRQAEAEVNSVLAAESDEESTSRLPESGQPPGAFIHDAPSAKGGRGGDAMRGAVGGDAPMGLFDVARGAASALQKTAFPLHGQRNVTLSKQRGEGAVGAGALEAGRTRKRDMVSGMVTGGLASGIGWVLGAQPVKEQE